MEYRSNWYIEVGAGAQVLFSADASKLSFGDRISPSISVAGVMVFSFSGDSCPVARL
ncbi:MAG: hypothetical protein V8R52_14020 [Coprobacter fastidiosus]